MKKNNITRVVTCIIFDKIVCWAFSGKTYRGIYILEHSKEGLSLFLLEILGKNQKGLLGPEVKDCNLPNKEKIFVEWILTDEAWENFTFKDQVYKASITFKRPSI